MVIQGFICVLTAEDGRVVAHSADFDRGGAAGFHEQDRQRIRARGRLAKAFMQATCNLDVADAVDGYDAERVLSSVVNKKGWKVTEIPIGYDEDDLK